MKLFRYIFSILNICIVSSSSAQDLQVRDIDQTKYPLIKVYLESKGPKKIDVSKILIFELGDSLAFEIMRDNTYKNNSAICLLLDSELLGSLNNEALKDLIDNLIWSLSENDKFNLLISSDENNNQSCIKPISFEFSSDFNGLSNYLIDNYNDYQYTKATKLNASTIKNSLKFIQEKSNLPSKKLLLIVSQYDETWVDSLTEIRNTAKKQGIAIHWLNLNSGYLNKNINNEDKQRYLLSMIDSVFEKIYPSSISNKNTIQFAFYTKQNKAVNQFEIEYSEKRYQSSFKNPTYKGFIQENYIFLLTIAILFSVIILLIIMSLKTKKKNSEFEKKIRTKSSPDIVKLKTNPESLIYSKIVYAKPSLSIDIEGIKSNYDISKAITQIGRREENDIIIDDLTVSSHHASILIEEGQILIQDNLSTNGTFVNDIKISKVILRNGDVIRLGKARIVLTY